MTGFRFAAAASLAGMVLLALLSEPALAQSEPVKRLKWFRSLFAGFVLAGLGFAVIAGSSVSRASTGRSCSSSGSS